MRFKCTDFIKDCSEYVDIAPFVYDAFQFVQSGYSKKDLHRLRVKLDRLFDNFPEVAYELFYSKIDTSYFFDKVQIRTGKRGKPTIINIGKEADPHIHLQIVAVYSCSQFDYLVSLIQQYLKEQSKKHQSIKQHKSKRIELRKNMKKLSDAVGCYHQYIKRQGEKDGQHGGCDFNWDYYDDILFTIEDEKVTVH